MKKVISISIVFLTVATMAMVGQPNRISAESLCSEIDKKDAPNTLSASEKKDG
jgi:hypothetical protein